MGFVLTLLSPMQAEGQPGSEQAAAVPPVDAAAAAAAAAAQPAAIEGAAAGEAAAGDAQRAADAAPRADGPAALETWQQAVQATYRCGASALLVGHACRVREPGEHQLGMVGVGAGNLPAGCEGHLQMQATCRCGQMCL